MKPHLFRSLCVQSFDHLEAVDLRKAGARSSRNASSGGPIVSARTVLPSEYAREDIASTDVFDAMWRTSLVFHREQGMESTIPCVSNDDCVDILPLIAARNWFYGPPRSITID